MSKVREKKMGANLFDVLNKVNALPGGKLHAYFMNNIQSVNAGSKKSKWGSIKIAIETTDASAILSTMVGNSKTKNVMLFVVDEDAIEQVKAEIEHE